MEDLDLTTAPSGTSLLERHRKPRAIPRTQGISKLDPDNKSLVGVQGTD